MSILHINPDATEGLTLFQNNVSQTYEFIGPFLLTNLLKVYKLHMKLII